MQDAPKQKKLNTKDELKLFESFNQMCGFMHTQSFVVLKRIEWYGSLTTIVQS